MRMAKWDRTQGAPEPIQALNRVIERENGEPLVDLRIAAPSVLIARPDVIPYARETVARMLHAAGQTLPEGFRLGVVDAWRPLTRQKRIYDWIWACAQEAFPHRTHAQLRRTVNRWAAPYDQKAPPGHCTGAAIDVWLFDAEDKPVDVSAPFERFAAAPTYAFGLSDDARAKRMLIVEAMLGAGFSNCRDEWWHYSYGDAGWAVRMGLTECVYGVAHLDDPSAYAEQEALSDQRMKRRPNLFLTGR